MGKLAFKGHLYVSFSKEEVGKEQCNRKYKVAALVLGWRIFYTLGTEHLSRLECT